MLGVGLFIYNEYIYFFAKDSSLKFTIKNIWHFTYRTTEHFDRVGYFDHWTLCHTTHKIHHLRKFSFDIDKSVNYAGKNVYKTSLQMNVQCDFGKVFKLTPPLSS